MPSFPDVFGMNSLFSDVEQSDEHFGSDELFITKKFIEKYGYESLAIVEPEEGELVIHDEGELRVRQEKVLFTQEERFNKACQLLKIDQKKLKENIRIVK